MAERYATEPVHYITLTHYNALQKLANARKHYEARQSLKRITNRSRCTASHVQRIATDCHVRSQGTRRSPSSKARGKPCSTRSARLTECRFCRAPCLATHRTGALMGYHDFRSGGLAARRLSSRIFVDDYPSARAATDDEPLRYARTATGSGRQLTSSTWPTSDRARPYDSTRASGGAT
jgi:hypothetical protein